MNQDSLVLRGARVIDPANKYDSVADLVIQNGKIIMEKYIENGQNQIQY